MSSGDAHPGGAHAPAGRALLALTAMALLLSCGSGTSSDVTALVMSPSGVPVLVVDRGEQITVRTPCGGTAELTEWTDIHDIRVVLDPGHGGEEFGGEDGDFYGVLRYSADTPAALSEAAFISNGAEATLLADPAVQQAEGDALARAIVRWFETDDPGSGFTDPSVRRPATDADPRPCADPDLG